MHNYPSDVTREEFEMMKRISALGINMSQPVEFGTCNKDKSVYQLLTWCEGEDAESALQLLPETEQYILGLKAGEILKKIHGLETLSESADWSKSYIRKLDGYIENYKNCGMTFDGDLLFLEYIEHGRKLIENRIVRPCHTHGDFHVGNLVVSPDKELFVIDFGRCRTRVMS